MDERQVASFPSNRKNVVLVVLTAFVMTVGAAACVDTEFGAKSAKISTKNSADDKGVPNHNDTKGADAGDGGDGNDGQDGNGNHGGSDASGDLGNADGGTVDANSDNANNGDLITQEDTIQNPQACDTVTSGKAIHVGDKCPEHFALYTMDDMGSHSSVPGVYACCPLPARDILLKSGEFQPRSRQCNANEVMTGVADTNGNIFCSAINTKRYSLQPGTVARTGSGSGGSGGAEVDAASLPPTLRALVIGPLGSDGCVAMPFGSLITKQGGRQCTDTASSTLVETATGAAIKMFPDQ